MVIFDHAQQKIIESTLRFPGFLPACKKISLFHHFISMIQSNLKSMTRLATPIFDHARPS